MQFYQTVCCLIILAIAVTAYPGGHAESYANHNQHHYGGHEEHHDHHEHHAPADYKYEYGVKDAHTGDHKDAWESSHGGVVKGSYSLHEADGTKRIVDYTADKHGGFHAHVTRVGHATHHYIPHHDEHHGHGF